MQQTIDKLKEEIRSADRLEPAKRKELEDIIETLSRELADLEKTDSESARSIGGFAGISAYESLRSKPDQQLREHALDGLKKSIESFEASHPVLSEAVQRLTSMLAHMGI